MTRNLIAEHFAERAVPAGVFVRQVFLNDGELKSVRMTGSFDTIVDYAWNAKRRFPNLRVLITTPAGIIVPLEDYS